MKSKNVRIVVKTSAKQISKTAKGGFGITLEARSQTAGSASVTPKSGKVISRTVIAHREALKRLADR